MSEAAQEFLRQAVRKSADLTHQQIIRRATQQSGQRAGKASFHDWEAARQRCYEIKSEALGHLDHYLLEFERKIQERGGQVFWAENAEEARRYITGIAEARGVHVVTKSKSMVAEEIQLTPALEKIGIKVFETDLGEFIVQLRHEPPYHLVTPAMHLTRTDIAALFKEKLEGVDGDDPEQLVAAARRALRRAFFSSEMSITGANFLVADAGMVAITTNEGNAELGMNLSKIHLVLTGIEKIVPHLDDLAILWPVLATAGTGQPVTCYNTLVGGPRAPHETDGPDEFHVVLLDNGRSELLADVEQREVLNCIRCGACLNVCPIFRTVGGHTYGTTYQGPIGSVLTPHLRGLHEFQHLSYASSLCGACIDVCPVKIGLHHHLLHNRRNAVSAGERPWSERIGFKVWRWAMMGSRRFALLSRLALSALRLMYRCGAEGTGSIRCVLGPKLVLRRIFRSIRSATCGGGKVQRNENLGRERILTRIRSALVSPTRLRNAGPSGQIFASIADPLERFRKECAANSTECLVTADIAASTAAVSEILESIPLGEIFLQDAPLLRRAAAGWTTGRDIRWSSEGRPNEATKATITLAESLVAATGSVFVSAGCGGRGASIVAPVHIVAATVTQLAADLATAFEWLRARGTTTRNSMVSLITGPSRTGDIEKIIVLGAHGPQRLVVVLALHDE